MRFKASDVAAATHGTLFGPDIEIDGVSFDSRSTRPGELFVAVVADRDGHEFVPAAVRSGAAACLVQSQPGAGTSIVVADTAAALMDLARWGRGRLRPSIHVVGITGSVGKTSTKDLAGAALSAGMRTTVNEKSFNNEQGLPVTILNAPDDTEALVLEMGMRGFGEITRLCDVGRPTIGVVTRVAAAHTERVGGIEGVTQAKGELVRALPRDGVAILNADDSNVMSMAGFAPCPVITFGHTGDADVRISELVLDELARPSFVLGSPWGFAHVRLAISGEHMALNAAAALAVACSCGVDLADATEALVSAHLSPWRMEVLRSTSGPTVLNDSYNANPASMRAAIETLRSMRVKGRRIALLGVMAELGDPVNDHAEIAALVADAGIELIAVGTDLYGIEPAVDPIEAMGSLSGNDAVLVKGSRVAGMERFAGIIVGQ